jgi:lipopolysaccharide/colanic/teichoic acid biosynthesis glycosyltransferase/folate-dependent phosphoribosylglycinamide formyltransferase PurN
MPRSVEVAAVGVGLAVLSPLMLVLAVLVRRSSPGPVLFKQERVGAEGRPFTMLKFRTMYVDAERRGGTLTVDADPRVTRIGRLLRRYKLDELPQLINVLRGEMRLVGPRPEVPEFVELYNAAQRAVLSVPPGITDPASLAYYREEELLAAADDPRQVYVDEIMPAKLELNLSYLQSRSWVSDLGVIGKTVLRAFRNDDDVPAAPTRVARVAPDGDHATPPAVDGRPRVAIVTNGNYFSNIALHQLLAGAASTYDFRVYVTTGLRRQKGNRLVELRDLIGRWGLRYFIYKFATYALPMVAQLVLRRPLFVATSAKQLGVPVEVVRSINTAASVAGLRAFAPDILLSYSCPYRIANDVLDIPSIGALNVHSSLLPRYAGVCTYVHVLADGQPVTGVTVHEMVERFDAGRIVAQQEVAIDDTTSVFALFVRQCRLAGPLLIDALAACVKERTVPGVPQDIAQRTYCGEPTRDDVARLRARGHRLMRVADVTTLLRGDRTTVGANA